MCAPNAQHAVRQAKVLANNIVAVIFGREVHQYRHKYAGSVASLGLHKGVAQVYGIKLRGFPAWIMHRTYHVSRIPSWNRRLRVVVDWTLALVLKREVVSMGELHEPREPFTEATPETRSAAPSATPSASAGSEPSVTRRA
jgi:NADH dehydrogenase